eukprot:scaffold109815_cov18-Prasinocladus_malaysianus.AAC.1
MWTKSVQETILNADIYSSLVLTAAYRLEHAWLPDILELTSAATHTVAVGYVLNVDDVLHAVGLLGKAPADQWLGMQTLIIAMYTTVTMTLQAVVKGVQLAIPQEETR